MVFAAVAFLAGAGSASAQSFELKPGQWEFTMSGMPVTGADLSKLPPNVRAQIEARMKQPSIYKSCVTPKDLKDLNLGKQDDDDDDACKVTSKTMTATTADVVRTCTGDRPRTESVHFEAPTRESLRGTIKVASAGGPASVTLSGKWIGAVCKEDN